MPDLTTTAIIPVYNGADRIGRALRSIADQSTPVDHIIVIDDGSTDDLDAALAAAAFSGTLIRQANGGQGAATNAGLRAASTSHVLFLDHDDEWPPDRVAWQVQAIRETDCDVVIGSVVNVWESTGDSVVERDMGPARVMGAGLFDRSCFDRVGLLPEDGRIHEVFDWWSRAADRLTVRLDSRAALRRHIHGGNMTMPAEDAGRRDLIMRVRAHRRRTGSSDAGTE